MSGPLATSQDGTRVIAGTFGKVFMDGKWLTNFNEMEASVEIKKSELQVAGDRWTKHKVVGLTGTGSIRGYKITSDLAYLNDPISDNENASVRTEIISKLADPEAYGAERVRLKNVMFDKIDLAKWKSQEHISEDWPFTFEGYELLDYTHQLKQTTTSASDPGTGITVRTTI